MVLFGEEPRIDSAAPAFHEPFAEIRVSTPVLNRNGRDWLADA